MKLKVNEIYYGFKLIQEEVIPEVEGIGRVFEHIKSGATFISIANEDSHKVFTLSFKTPPINNMGIPHIVEHTVCCASEKYPLKETFMMMEKGSICTSLNACTYPDVTMYYAASPSEKDLLGLMEVYMDLAFHPSIYKEEQLFMQEGWRYELKEEDDPLTITGVVYHEMEGEYGEATTCLEHVVNEALFPNTVYRYDAGGVPEEIQKLSREAFLNFHKTHYQGSNSLIYSYGDGDVLAQLEKLDLCCLKDLAFVPTQIEIPLQAPPVEPVTVRSTYPALEEEESQTLLSLSFVVGEATDVELRLALELLEHMLLRSSASPLLEALVLEDELGIGLGEGGYDTGKRQPVFSIVLKGSDESKAKAFEQKVFEVLKQIVEEGIDEALVEAALHTLAFELKEVDAGFEPVGIQYSEMILSSYLYEGEAFAHLKYTKSLAHIEAEKHKRYFEKLIEIYFLNNKHRVLAILVPEVTNHEELLEEELAAYKNSLDKEQLSTLVAQNKALEEAQEVVNSPEQLALLPRLTREDMVLQVPEMKIDSFSVGTARLFYHQEHTRGIAYIHLLFDTSHLEQEEVSYLGLLTHLLTYVGTEKSDYRQIENAINGLTGGMNCALHAYRPVEGSDYYPLLKLTSKVLMEQLSQFTELLKEILIETSFKEKAKLKELIGNIQYELERSFQGAPEYRATQRVYTYFAPEACYEDQVVGISFYHFVKALYQNFDQNYEQMAVKLKEILTKVILQNQLSLYITAEEKDQETIIKAMRELIESLPQGAIMPKKYVFKAEAQSEAYCVAQKVQSIAKGFDFKRAGFKYHGSLEVLANLLESQYLWEKVRLKGGAYGCEINISREGYLVVCSYCDPHLEQTLKSFNEINEYLENLELDSEELERYIISTLGTMQAPLSMEQKSERALNYTLLGMTPEAFKQTMEEVLHTDIETLRSFSKLFKAFAETHFICVIGSKKQIKKCEKAFETIID